MSSHTPEFESASVSEVLETWNQPRSSEALAKFVIDRHELLADTDLGI